MENNTSLATLETTNPGILSAGAFAAVLVCGIVFAGSFSWPLAVFCLPGAVSLGLAGWYVYRRHIRQASYALLAVFFFAGAIRLITAEVVAVDDVSRLEGQTLAVSATVAEVPEVVRLDEEQVKVKYILAVNQVADRQGNVRRVSGKIAVSLPQSAKLTVAAYGQSVRFTGKITSLHGYNNPGAYDLAAAMKRQGIGARAQLAGNRLEITGGDRTAFLQQLADWRKEVSRYMLSVMPAEYAAVLSGMVFGGYAGIPSTVVKDFSVTGIVHILSVSGTHVALVAGCLLKLGSRLGLRFGFSALLAAAAVLLYGCVAGFSPPVVRSAAMGIIMLAAVGFDREKDAAAALAVAAIAMLAYQPGWVYDLSFQLSFGATAGLVYLYPLAREKLKRLPKWLAAGIAVTFAAQASVLPVLAWYFNSLSLSAFLANLLIVPVVEGLVILALAASLLGIVWPWGAASLFLISGALTGLVIQATSLVAAIPGGSLYLPSLNLGQSLIYYLLLFWLFGLRLPWLPEAALLLRQWPRAAGCSAAGLLCLSLVWNMLPEPVSVHFIDVGQGDATLVTTPHGRAILIDTGGIMAQGSDFDIGERVVLPYLRHYGILSLDYLILTHGHQDHAGGAAAIAAAIPVKHILVAAEEPTPAIQKLAQVRKRATLIPTFAGQTILLDEVSIEVVHAADARARSGNEASSVLRVAAGPHSFLITGDATAEEERQMVKNGLLPVSVLKAGHHGAKTSTTQEFLEALKPGYAVISAGAGNRYGHPNPEVLERLTKNSVKILRTDQNGAVLFRAGKDFLQVKTCVE